MQKPAQNKGSPNLIATLTNHYGSADIKTHSVLLRLILLPLNGDEFAEDKKRKLFDER